MNASTRNTSRYIHYALLPFLVLILVSLLNRPAERARMQRFYEKMKAPGGVTPEEEAEAMRQTELNLGGFDHTKLFPGSAWEVTRWNAVDAIGFALCVATFFAILGVFWTLLELDAG